jgi:hypothetical protein
MRQRVELLKMPLSCDAVLHGDRTGSVAAIENRSSLPEPEVIPKPSVGSNLASRIEGEAGF